MYQKRQTPEPSLRGSSDNGREAHSVSGRLHHPFALGFFASELAGAAYSLGLLARFFLGRFLEMLPKLHFTENALTLQLFL